MSPVPSLCSLSALPSIRRLPLYLFRTNNVTLRRSNLLSGSSVYQMRGGVILFLCSRPFLLLPNRIYWRHSHTCTSIPLVPIGRWTACTYEQLLNGLNGVWNSANIREVIHWNSRGLGKKKSNLVDSLGSGPEICSEVPFFFFFGGGGHPIQAGRDYSARAFLFPILLFAQGIRAWLAANVTKWWERKRERIADWERREKIKEREIPVQSFHARNPIQVHDR
jgi:hypothetical protein